MEVVILGIIQGIAEFLPISSSAHLIIARSIFGIGASIVGNLDLTFDLALHFGTLLAIIIFFFKDLWRILKDGITKGTKTSDGKLFWYLIIATIPAGIVGVLFENVFDSFFRKRLYAIAIALIVMGFVIYIIDKKAKKDKVMKSLSLKDVLIIGCAQVFALIPGFSRSGTTIAAGRALNLNREDAAKFSFYLAIPVVGGACFISLLKGETIKVIMANLSIFGIGVITSFIVGILCISFLLKYLRKHDFKIFMWYRLALGLLVILILLLK